jgi:hypothetical protein
MTNITLVLDEAEAEALQDLLAHANENDYEANHSLSEQLDNAIWAASKEVK